ncbi:hypothetical protein SXIM_08630 [Streptomyces xiamenensis]|uniref:Uncharacterized protein n=1 Tax=Streptomyces xiamenensis TaxID=408015 RepID=A0A0F7FRS5_9ACTN|nr:hypothetical protein SXIM_08630 [Streptomyces xiamenensis]
MGTCWGRGCTSTRVKLPYAPWVVNAWQGSAGGLSREPAPKARGPVRCVFGRAVDHALG